MVFKKTGNTGKIGDYRAESLSIKTLPNAQLWCTKSLKSFTVAEAFKSRPMEKQLIDTVQWNIQYARSGLLWPPLHQEEKGGDRLVQMCQTLQDRKPAKRGGTDY